MLAKALNTTTPVFLSFDNLLAASAGATLTFLLARRKEILADLTTDLQQQYNIYRSLKGFHFLLL